MSDEKPAIERITEALAAPDGTLSRRNFHAKAHQLAMQWPSLAAALGDLLVEQGVGVPGPFRHAQNVMAQEREHERVRSQDTFEQRIKRARTGNY